MLRINMQYQSPLITIIIAGGSGPQPFQQERRRRNSGPGGERKRTGTITATKSDVLEGTIHSFDVTAAEDSSSGSGFSLRIDGSQMKDRRWMEDL